MELFCVKCGTKFEAKDMRTHLCPACKVQPKPKTRICVVCGSETNNRKYCSPECQHKARLEKIKAHNLNTKAVRLPAELYKQLKDKTDGPITPIITGLITYYLDQLEKKTEK